MSERRIARNRVVYLTYRIVDAEGELHEQVDLPVGYVHGTGSRLFPQIEAALEGRQVGDEVEVTLSPEEGFGFHQPELTYTDTIENVPPEFRRLGAEAEFQNAQGETLTMVVTRMEGGRIHLDGNHPLAGKTVTFHVTVKEVRDATPEELKKGVPAGGERLH